MANAEKLSAVAELAQHFRSSNAAVITEYRGLTVKQVSELRRALGRQTTYAVVKNTLTKRAVSDAGLEVDDALLTGPTAIAFVGGDPVEAAKGLRDFARANPLLVIKGGLMEGKALSVSEVNRIADLESREVLLAKLAGALKALPTRAAGLFQAPLSQMARLAAALEEKKPATAPAEDATAPAEDATASVEDATASAEEGTASAEEGTASAEEATTPAEEGTGTARPVEAPITESADAGGTAADTAVAAPAADATAADTTADDTTADVPTTPTGTPAEPAE